MLIMNWTTEGMTSEDCAGFFAYLGCACALVFASNNFFLNQLFNLSEFKDIQKQFKVKTKKF